MGENKVRDRKRENDSNQRDERDAMLYEIRSNLEKKLAILNRIGSKLDDEDEEENSRRLLEIQDTSPFIYSSDYTPDVSENDILRSTCLDKNSVVRRNKTLAQIFKRWCEDSQDPASWIKASNLLLMFKFTIRRPLVPESSLWYLLKYLGLDPKLSFVDDLIEGDVESIQRSRNVLHGFIPEPLYHVSSLKNRYPKGTGLLHEELESSTGLEDQKNRKMEKIAELAAYIAMYYCGRFESHQAVSLIRNIFNGSTRYEDVRFMLYSDRFLHREPLMTARSLWKKFSSEEKSNQEGQALHLVPDEEFVKLCDDIFHPHNTLQNAIDMIRDACQKMEFSVVEKLYILRKFNVPQDLFTAKNYFDKTLTLEPATKQEINQAQSRNSTRISSEPVGSRLSSNTNGSRPNSAPNGDGLPSSLMNEYKSDISSDRGINGHRNLRHDAPAPKSNTGAPPLSLSDSELTLGDNNPNIVESKRHQDYQHISMGPPVLPCLYKTPSKSLDQQSCVGSKRIEERKRSLDTLRISTSSKDIAPRDDISDVFLNDTNNDSLSASPEDGFSDGLFGLPLNTKTARALGTELRLPPNHINMIRSITPNRLHRKRIQRESTLVLFPNKKSKISHAAHAKYQQEANSGIRPGLFARDGEDALDFVESHMNAGIFENTKRRFLKELQSECTYRAEPAKLQTTDTEMKQQFCQHPSIGNSRELEAQTYPTRSIQNDSQDSRGMKGSLRNTGLNGCNSKGAQPSDRVLPFMSAFPFLNSVKDALIFLKKLEAMPESNSNKPSLYNSCYFVVEKLRERRTGHPGSDDEHKVFALLLRLAHRSQEFRKRLPFEDSSYNLNLPQCPVKIATYQQGPASFQEGRINAKIQSVFNKNPDCFVGSDLLHSGMLLGKPLLNAGPPIRSRNTSKCSEFPQGFLSKSCLVKPARCSTLLVNGSLRKNTGELQQILHELKDYATITNAEDIALRDRVSLSLFLALRRQLRAMANSRIPKYRYFQSPSGASGAANMSTALNKLFERYRDNPIQEPDSIGVEGSMRYLGDLGVKLDEAVLLAVLTELSAPTMGELSRHGFVEGWKKNHADSLSKQQTVISTFRRALSENPDFFKRVYKNAFLLARNPGQKSLTLEVAVEYWRLLLQAPSNTWNTNSTPWLDWWITYLEERWKKGISKDMWDQTGVFIQKTQEDESMAWWSEDGAWPGAIDEFVGYIQEKRRAAGGGGDGMDVA